MESLRNYLTCSSLLFCVGFWFTSLYVLHFSSITAVIKHLVANILSEHNYIPLCMEVLVYWMQHMVMDCFSEFIDILRHFCYTLEQTLNDTITVWVLIVISNQLVPDYNIQHYIYRILQHGRLLVLENLSRICIRKQPGWSLCL